jgi:hypothetical protein
MKVNASGARFWAVDLHTHTPGSEDAREEDFGTAADFVQAALDAGLDAIAVTDHNRADWCDQIADAAKGTELVVLPGFELSTSDGHLLGIWDEDTSVSELEDVLIKLGIDRANFGKLDVVAKEGMARCAELISEAGGVAIAAHIEKERGFLRLAIPTHANSLLACESIRAYEYVRAETIETVRAKLATDDIPAMVQGSDCWCADSSRHCLSGIGARRTWIKASRPDLRGLCHAFDDPELRVTVENPFAHDPHPTIDRVRISAGFLSGTTLDLNPDLNCLLGGTGAGKSLVLEAIRFALEQQVDETVFSQVRDEVDRRLEFALADGAEVTVDVTVDNEKYRFTRMYSDDADAAVSHQLVGEDWIEVDLDPAELIPLAAFSQGEILEYARQPVGRVGLVDAHLDLGSIEGSIADFEGHLRANARRLIKARDRVNDLSGEASKAGDLREQVRKLSDVLKTDAVQEQGKWTKEQTALNRVADAIKQFERPSVVIPGDIEAAIDGHGNWATRVNGALKNLRSETEELLNKLQDSFTTAETTIGTVRGEWNQEFSRFKRALDQELEKVSGSTSLAAIRAQLESLQGKLEVAEAAAKELDEVARPELASALENREKLLVDLREARKQRRNLRRERIKILNAKTSNFVKLDIPRNGDTSQFRKALGHLKVGSQVRETALDAIAGTINPYRFVRSLWQGDVNDLVDNDAGIKATDVGRLLTTIADRDMWADLLEAQIIDIPDVLDVKFKKPEEGILAPIESLSHGQKCTAILVILLADGDSPVLVDQPEDALHAPWIEEYLVNQLRNLRGTRQYIFATRSPGLVVSADAEQIVTMRATAGRGECEASGSLERHDLNKLALHHLEGGPRPFQRRTRKLNVSISAEA